MSNQDGSRVFNELVAALVGIDSDSQFTPKEAKGSPDFKPVFKGYMKLFLHDDVPERLADRADFTGQWIRSRRKRIMKKDRKFQVTLHILDTDGNKRGLQSMVFKDKGGQGNLSKVIFGFGNNFVDEIRKEHPDVQIDLINSYAVVRA